MAAINIQIEAPVPVPYSSTEWSNLLKTCNDFGSGIPLVSVSLTSSSKTNAEKTLTPLYDYQFVSLDGRTWKETVAFLDNVTSGPSMTFNVPDAWKASECTLAQAFFDALVMTIQKFGVTTFTVSWT